MTEQENLRDIVCDILLETEKTQALSHIVIRQMLEKYQYLDNRQRRFISRLARGTMERRISLDWMIDQFSKIKTKKMKPVIRTILRMSVYQIKYMDGVPVSAVCNEAVKIAKKRGFKNLSGFVNGILRNMSRNPEKLDLPEGDLSVFYGQPRWLVDYWMACYGEDRTRQMFEYFLKEQPLTVRVCQRGLSPEAFKKRMEEQQIEAVPNALVPEAFELKGYDYLGALPEFRQGLCTVQDISSMLAVKAAGIRPEDEVIDVCAAPGGKSLMISELLSTGKVTARDLTWEKVELIEENIQRLNGEHIEAQCQDALEFVPEDAGRADVVLADLPCSGLGVIGRKPDIRERMNRETMTELAELQREILSVVSKYVKSGGTLIYSTCTVNPEENQENVRWFLENFPFEAESLRAFLPEAVWSETVDEGSLQLFPGEHGTDGFFIARFRRR